MVDTSVVEQAYKEVYDQYGDTSKGVFWPREEDTPPRMNALTGIVKVAPFSALDFGCGTGVLASYLEPLGLQHYVGVDTTEASREAAQVKFPQYEFVDKIPQHYFNYTFASGVFNYCASMDKAQWEQWVKEQVQALWDLSVNGMALNFLTYKPDWTRDFLWYPESTDQIISWIDKPKTVKVVENYGLKAEWTLLVTR